MIPGVDGIEVCRRIKSDATSKTIIIAISGQPETEKKILSAGADSFMAKPVDMDRLLSEAARLLRIL
jgi:two-component system cell cycle response regulator